MKENWKDAALALKDKPEEFRRHYVSYAGLVETDGGLTEEYNVLGHTIHKGFWETMDQYYMDTMASRRFVIGKEMDLAFELSRMEGVNNGAA